MNKKSRNIAYIIVGVVLVLVLGTIGLCRMPKPVATTMQDVDSLAVDSIEVVEDTLTAQADTLTVATDTLP